MACGGCAKRAGKLTYTHTDPSGRKTTYSTQAEADAARIRKGGTVSKG